MDHSNGSVKGRDENEDDNVTGNANSDSDADKVVHPKNPTKRLVKKLKWKVEKLGGISA